MDARVRRISSLISEFSQRKFTKKGKVSGKQDYIDGIIFALNMLGEEMAVTTISKNYFTSIFNSLFDIIIVLDKSLQITSTNNAFTASLGHEITEVKKAGLDILLNAEDLLFLKKDISKLNIRVPSSIKEIEFCAVTGSKIPFLVTISKMFDEKNIWTGFLLVAKDYTFQKQAESVLLRAIIDTQEKERTRFAKDIHDSLGQKLSALKFFLSSSINLSDNSEQKNILVRSNNILTTVIGEMRDICFAIMPSNLKDFGLIKAVKELVKGINLHNKIDIRIRTYGAFQRMDPAKEIIIYRIVQELIGNALKHSNASVILIKFKYTTEDLSLCFVDNGKGFNVNKTNMKTSGINNIRTRVSACNGTLYLESKKKEGTKFEIILPLK